MVTPFSDTFSIFHNSYFCVKNAIQTIFSKLLLLKQRVPWTFTIVFTWIIFLDKTMNCGKIVKIRDFHYFLFEPTKIRNDFTDTGAELGQIFNPSIKNWRNYGRFRCCHGNCKFIFISWCSFWGHWGTHLDDIFFWFSCCWHYSPYFSLISGRHDALKKVAILQKIALFFNFWQFAGAWAHRKGLRRLNPCQLQRNVYWHCENDINVGIVLVATNGLSFTDKRQV